MSHMQHIQRFAHGQPNTIHFELTNTNGGTVLAHLRAYANRRKVEGSERTATHEQDDEYSVTFPGMQPPESGDYLVRFTDGSGELIYGELRIRVAIQQAKQLET